MAAGVYAGRDLEEVPGQSPPFLAFPYGHRRVYVGVIHPDHSGKYRVSSVFRDSLHLPLPQKRGLQGYMCLVCGLSQRGAVREHGDKLSHLGGLQLGQAEDSTCSVGEGLAAIPACPSLASVFLSEFLQAFAVAVRTFAEKGSGPLAEVEDMVAKANTDDPFRKFRGRP